MPLGFESRDLWAVRMHVGDEEKTRIDGLQGLRGPAARPDGDAECAMSPSSPSSPMSTRACSAAPGARPARRWRNTELLDADDRATAVLGLKLVEGRWFSALDNGSADRPAVINRKDGRGDVPGRARWDRSSSTAREAGRAAPRGRRGRGLPRQGRAGGAAQPCLHPLRRRDQSRWDVRTILLRVAPGTERAFEKAPQRERLGLIHRGLELQVRALVRGPFHVLRSSYIKG